MYEIVACIDGLEFIEAVNIISKYYLGINIIIEMPDRLLLF